MGGTSEELAYIAGFLDGEGTIALRKVRCGKSHAVSIQVRIANNDLAALLWIQEVLGVGYIHPRKRTGNPNHKQAYIWYVCGQQDALSVLYVLRPYVMLKSERLENTIEYIESRLVNPLARLTSAEWRLVEVTNG